MLKAHLNPTVPSVFVKLKHLFGSFSFAVCAFRLPFITPYHYGCTRHATRESRRQNARLLHKSGSGHGMLSVAGPFSLTALLCGLLTLLPSATVCGANENGNAQYVDPFIGTEGGGNVFPGACVPFGMVKLGPDCGNMEWNAGWAPDGNIHGFSHTHVSGTGGGCKYGNILMLPMTGVIDLSDYSSPRKNEQASVGEYSVELTRYGTSARLTALDRAALHEYTFPAATDSRILFDMGSCLALKMCETQKVIGSEVRILSPTELEGYTRVRGGWNEGEAYTVYFHAETDTPAVSFGTWKDGKTEPGKESQFDSGQKTGAYMTFNTTAGQKIRVRVGISYISCGRASANMRQVDTWDFDKVKAETTAKWNRVLDKVELDGDKNDKVKFYTALYHCYLQPTDKTGENPKWTSAEPNYDDFYAIWDTFRATHPLFTILTPSRQADMLRSLIDIWRNDGYMPDARSGNDNGRVQGGSNCDILFADAIVKGVEGVDYEAGLQAMLKNAEVPPGGDERKEGRGGLNDYNTLGYVSAATERCLTRTLEYSNCDFAIATVANRLGKNDIADRYYRKASNWQNTWNDDIECLGHKGFAWPRERDGSFLAEDKYTVLTGGGWENPTYETFSFELSMYVPHDMKSLIARCGGQERFTQRLDTFFTHNNGDQRWLIGMYQIANEPGFLAPSLYNYVNRQDKTARLVRYILADRYKTTRDVIPGNDDSGSMSAWYVFHSLGFYPNAGQDVYLVSSPVFRKATLHLENGRTLRITARNNSDRNIYVQSVRLNGKPLGNNWFRHSDIKDGGTLEFVMGPEPSGWSRNGVLPPSMSDTVK